MAISRSETDINTTLRHIGRDILCTAHPKWRELIADGRVVDIEAIYDVLTMSYLFRISFNCGKCIQFKISEMDIEKYGDNNWTLLTLFIALFTDEEMAKIMLAIGGNNAQRNTVEL